MSHPNRHHFLIKLERRRASCWTRESVRNSSQRAFLIAAVFASVMLGGKQARVVRRRGVSFLLRGSLSTVLYTRPRYCAAASVWRATRGSATRPRSRSAGARSASDRWANGPLTAAVRVPGLAGAALRRVGRARAAGGAGGRRPAPVARRVARGRPRRVAARRRPRQAAAPAEDPRRRVWRHLGLPAAGCSSGGLRPR